MTETKSIVEQIYHDNYNITELELAEEIVKHEELTTLDLWLLPQYPFDQWRRKYDYPNILNNIKSNQNDFSQWMQEQGITDEYLLNGYFSDFFENYPYSNDKRRYLIKVSYQGKTKFQSWHKYDGQTSSEGDGEPVLYEFIKEYISYYDWQIEKGREGFNFTKTFHRHQPNTPNEQVWLNHNFKLLKMGGLRPPVNGVGTMLRGKKLEFVNASGLELHGTIYFGSMGNLEFDHCAVDNLVCNELDMPSLHFQNCSIKNIQIRNSNIESWMFITSDTTGNIIDSKLSFIRIFGGLFNPTFTNSEAGNVDVKHEGLIYDNHFEKTYRALAKSAKEAGNKELYRQMKISEFDFIRKKKSGLKKLAMTADKCFWAYGQKPKRLIFITLLSIFLFGLFYSLFPDNFKGMDLTGQPYWKVFFNTQYYSIVTFTTLGYGDLSPIGFVKIFAAIEALLGAITLGFLVAGLSRNE